MGDMITNFIQAIATYFSGLGNDLWDASLAAISDLALSCLDAFLELIPPSAIAWLNAHPLTGFFTQLRMVTYYVPILQMIGIFVVALGIVTTIRTLRWIKAFIPSVRFLGFGLGNFGSG